ncbi:uncharacterized protein LOC129305836 isoform X2 [Prosopis cineraria]|uniref:uncharacterized protein LOC129305836 isoform X2 n=1 Tax=Prosopis cineraria TaxID=364024 RepID=UPI00240F861C|nr:uncharacterized protein LOC129305836 isoform X2 [Prosopis cineraria]
MLLGTTPTLVPTLDSATLVSKSSDTNQKNQKGKVTCEHCKKIGHTCDTCWDIHGKSTDWKPRKGKTRGYQASHDVPLDKIDSTLSAPKIDKEQLGATDHMTSDSKLFSTYVPNAGNETVTTANGSLSIAGTGFLIGEDDWSAKVNNGLHYLDESTLIAYFAERLISKETLLRNGVKQRMFGYQIVIVFPYHRQGDLVSCKYRDMNKKFWQEADTEKIFYGLDDIEGQSDIIIVEGEMDKLAMEEAGFRNCVSVPDGAPAMVSSKGLPPKEKDNKYLYLWNCKDYIKGASRIILATDGDLPGQALAEELARRIGKERSHFLPRLSFLPRQLLSIQMFSGPHECL